MLGLNVATLGLKSMNWESKVIKYFTPLRHLDLGQEIWIQLCIMGIAGHDTDCIGKGVVGWEDFSSFSDEVDL